VREIQRVIYEIDSMLYRVFRRFVFRFLYILFTFLPINARKITILSDSKEEMSDNFECVYNELRKTNNDLQYFILLKRSVDKKKTYKEMLLLAYNIATSKIILIDDYYPMIYPLKIRKKAELIQLWHAVGAFKKFGYSRVGKPGGPLKTYKDHKNYTKAIVSSEKVRSHYAEGFGIEIEKVIPTGIPRTDIFFNEEFKKQKKASLLSKYPFLENKKVILYAPTFRGSGQQSAYFPFDQLELEKINDSLKEECIFIVKMHPFVREEIKIPTEYSNTIFDFTNQEQINDLLFITDILVTDYSSVCFEFSLLNKPIIFYCFDLDEYKEARDFYTPFNEFAPGPIVQDCDALLLEIERSIENTNINQFEFTSKYFDHFDGMSTQRVVRVIEQILLEE
jgi:CDP-ribitol ribitolphosphotransferase